MKNLGNRMKRYEAVSSSCLIRRTPVIIRLDGKAFHTLTKGLKRPWDERFVSSMDATALALCRQIEGCKMAYVQSDEISLLLTDYEQITTEAWFDYNISKVVSVSASIATAAFNKTFNDENKTGLFDSRAFNVSKEDALNYFLWRQKDAERNSLQSLAQANFSHKELHKVNTTGLHELLHKKGINWNDSPTQQKRGRCVVKECVQKIAADDTKFYRNNWIIDNEIPIFSQDKTYIENFVYPIFSVKY